MASIITLKRGASKNRIKSIIEKLAHQLKPKGINAYNYVGKIKLEKDALSIQRALRDDWE